MSRRRELNMAKYGKNKFDLNLKVNQDDFLILNFALWNLPTEYEELRERFKQYSIENEPAVLEKEDMDDFVTTMSHLILGLMPHVHQSFMEAMFNYEAKEGFSPAIKHILDDLNFTPDEMDALVEDCERDPNFMKFLDSLGIDPKELGLDPTKAGINIEDEYDELDEH